MQATQAQPTRQEEFTLTSADHLVGNLWFDLDSLPYIANVITPETMLLVAPGPAAWAYGEMCRLLESPNERLAAGSLEANLRAQRFDFDWLRQVQARIEPESVDTLESYANTIVNVANLRKLQEACHQATKDAMEPNADATQVAGALMASISGAQSKAVEMEHISQSVSRLRRNFAAMEDGSFDWGSRTGFAALDRMFRMADGDLITLGGRPSQGKTSLARQIALNRARELKASGEPGQVVIFTADDTTEKLLTALACGQAQVNTDLLRDGKMQRDDWARIDTVLEELESLPIYVDQTKGPTVQKLMYRCAMLQTKAPIKLVVFDYHGLIEHPNPNAPELTVAEYAAKGCKNIAGTLKFPWLMLSQLRKAVDDRPDKWPTPADARYAGEAESDVMLFVMRPEHYLSRGEDCEHDPGDEQGVALLNVAKNKTGKLGKVKLAFCKEWSRFFDMQRVELNDY